MRRVDPLLCVVLPALVGGCYLSHALPTDTQEDETSDDGIGGTPLVVPTPTTPGVRDELRADESTLPHPVTAIAAGENTTCAIRSGEVYCWGYGRGGLLGRGYDEPEAFSPRRVELPGHFVGLDVGTRFACAWRDDGDAYCWGIFPWEWSVETPFDSQVRMPSALGLRNVRDMSIGPGHSCASTDNGTFCWGFDIDGERAFGVDGTFTAEPRQVPITGPVYVSQRRRCALDDGRLRCIGDLFLQEQATRLVSIGFGPDILDASFGDHHACALRADGVLRCVGWNAEGQIDGSLESHTTPVDVRVRSGEIIDVAVGWQHTCAIIADGSVWCWGANGHGEAGGSIEDRVVREPAPVHIESAFAIVAGRQHTCAIVTAGTMWCWGHAEYGQLGDGARRGISNSETHVPKPVRVLFE